MNDDVVDGFGNVITGFRALQYKEALANQNDQKDIQKRKQVQSASAAKNPNYGDAEANYNPGSGDGKVMIKADWIR